MEPIAIIYSDIHHALWNSYNHHYRRTKNGLKVEKIIKLKAKLLKVPILFCGDLIHKDKNMTNELIDQTLPTFNKRFSSGPDTYAISGNHDQGKENTLDQPSYSYINTFSKVFPKLHCIDNQSIQTRKFKIHGVPYLTHDIGLNKAIKMRIKELARGWPNILLLHTNLPGALDTDGREMETHLKKDIYKLLKAFDMVLVGHIHAPMKLAKNVYQIGAPNHQRKTDRDMDLGYWTLYDTMEMIFTPIKMPKFVELEFGETAPDTKDFYYNKPPAKAETKSTTKHNFSEVNNRKRLAKNYLRERHIKDHEKAEALLKVIKDLDD